MVQFMHMMQKNKMIKFQFIIIIGFGLTIGCNSTKDSVAEKELKKTEPIITKTVETTNAKENIDWQGSYYGRTSCESPCRGIETHLILTKDGNYIYKHNEIGIENGELVLNGQFNWDINNRYISLQGNDFQDRVHYLVDQNRLRRMGDMKEELFTDRSAELDLVKVKNPLKNTKWKLIELDGEKMSPENELKLFLAFEADGKFYASGGCNSIFGSYFLTNKNGVQFAQIVSSEKECLFDHYDQALINALNATQLYLKTQENQLHLTIGKRAPFAKFMATK